MFRNDGSLKYSGGIILGYGFPLILSGIGCERVCKQFTSSGHHLTCDKCGMAWTSFTCRKWTVDSPLTLIQGKDEGIHHVVGLSNNKLDKCESFDNKPVVLAIVV